MLEEIPPRIANFFDGVSSLIGLLIITLEENNNIKKMKKKLSNGFFRANLSSSESLIKKLPIEKIIINNKIIRYFAFDQIIRIKQNGLKKVSPG